MYKNRENVRTKTLGPSLHLTHGKNVHAPVCMVIAWQYIKVLACPALSAASGYKNKALGSGFHGHMTIHVTLVMCGEYEL